MTNKEKRQAEKKTDMVLADSKQRLQEAMEIVTASLNTMTEHTRKGWLAYIGEAIEADCGYASLIDLQSVIDERFRNEGW